MKKATFTLVVTLFLITGFGLMVCAEMGQQGQTSGKTYYTGTLTMLSMDNKRVQINYEGYGVYVADIKSDILHHAIVHVVGALHAKAGDYQDSGMAVFTRPDGDKIFATYKASGTLGQTAHGSSTYVGGTGRFVGIQGSGEFTRYSLRPPAQGMFASYSVGRSDWKLPKKSDTPGR